MGFSVSVLGVLILLLPACIIGTFVWLVHRRVAKKWLILYGLAVAVIVLVLVSQGRIEVISKFSSGGDDGDEVQNEKSPPTR